MQIVSKIDQILILSVQFNKMSICQGVKKDGEKCAYKAQKNGYCKIHKKQAESIKSCITITFGDVAENHVRMQKIGKEAEVGLSLEDLNEFKKYFDEQNYQTELFHLNNKEIKDAEDAYLLVVRNGCNLLADSKELHMSLNKLDWDSKAFMYGKVLNKKARYNLCFAETHQNADLENGKGTVVAFNEIPELLKIRNKLSEICEEKCKNLLAEGNLYYDVKECGIGFHGDAERKIVAAIRLGESMELAYQWYYKSKRVGKMFKVVLNHGDFYVMSAKAVGNDWKKKNVYTLRHAAGSDKYIK